MAEIDKEEFLHFAAAALGVAAVDGDTAYGMIPQWDSVQHLRLVMELESHYGVRIPIDAVARLRTIDEFYDYCVSS